MKKMLPVFIVLLIVVGGGAFYGGMKYDQSRRVASFGARAGMGNFQAGTAGARRVGGNTAAGAGFATGEVVTKDDKSLTIKLRDGGSKIVFFSPSTTQVMKAATGSMDDIKIGQNIMVNGTANQDGSFSAKSVQLTSSSTVRF